MASRRKETPQLKGPEIPLNQGLILLRELLREGEGLATNGANTNRIDAWYTSVEKVLKQTFGEGSGHLGTWWGHGSVLMVVSGWESQESEASRARKTFSERRQALAAIIEAGEGELRREELLAESISPQPKKLPKPELDTSQVFIVHGRDEALRETCARFVEKLGLKPIILHEQANRGLTLLEKFEKHAVSGYAVVLITGDDVGCLATDCPDELKPRARQNVIYELGFFAGAIGRSRVCALYEPGVELPSDLVGLAVVEIDPAGAWQFKIGREMKAAGLQIDLNALA